MGNRFIFVLSFLLLSTTSFAGPREDAHFLVNRILGTKLSSPQEFEQIVTMISQGRTAEAADFLTKHKDFYNVQLKNHFTPRTNEESSKLVFLNDYTATLIGMVRDDVSYKSVLSEDILYTGSANLANIPAYSHTDNRHYEELDKRRIDLSNPQNLIRRRQSEIAGTQVPASATAGIMTTRQAAAAFFSAGTNRAMFRFVMMNYMCRDVEAVHDVSRPSDRIRKDISRAEPFSKDCLGCHSVMDPLSGAFAKYEYDLEQGRLVYSAQGVQDKNNINDNVFPGGYTTVDDSWRNYMRGGVNSALGWRAPAAGVTMNQKFGYTSGRGAKSMGMELANSKAFSACAVKQVFEKVCLKSEGNLDTQDRIKLEEIATSFEASGYNYRKIWVDSALYCLSK